MQIDVQIRGIEQIKIRNDAIYQDLQTALLEELQAIARETRTAALAAAPTFTGALRQGIRMRSSRKFGILSATVKATAPHSWLVQHGRRPGKMPSIDPRRAKSPKSAQRLANWAKAHGIEPFVLARSIARKGTRARPFMTAAILHGQQSLEPRIRGAVERVLARHGA